MLKLNATVVAIICTICYVHQNTLNPRKYTLDPFGIGYTWMAFGRKQAAFTLAHHYHFGRNVRVRQQQQRTRLSHWSNVELYSGIVWLLWHVSYFEMESKWWLWQHVTNVLCAASIFAMSQCYFVTCSPGVGLLVLFISTAKKTAPHQSNFKVNIKWMR